VTPQTAMAAAAVKLRDAGIADAARDVRLLWDAAMPHRFVDAADLADGVALARFDALIARRMTRIPVSHLLGYRDFYAHRFIVTPDVLDPRPDTETLVAQALERPFTRVLDLGTGSGCILLSLLAARRGATGVGVDYAQAALDVAAQNVTQLGLDAQVTLRQSDWFENVDGEFDLIVSNPPYIAAKEMVDLQPEVQLFEPRLALTDEADGLECYRKIIARHDHFLQSGGWLMVEIGPSQGAAVSQMMTDAGLLHVSVIPDMDARDRVVIGQKKHVKRPI